MSNDVIKSVGGASRIHPKDDPQQASARTFFIDASNRSLTTIPSEILQLEELEEAHLENNQIEAIPPGIQRLRNVRILYLNRNKLSELCPELGKLGSLEGLDLSHNPLLSSSLPVLSGLRRLRELRLYHTGLAEIPIVICKFLHHLELLGLSGNHLRSLPKELVNQTKLREIYLKQNQLEVFPAELCVLTNLEIIDLDENKLAVIPEEIGNLKRLQKFYLAYNSLPVLPEALGHCSQLSVLDLSYNRLHSIPHTLAELVGMTEIGLSGNHLEKVPRLVCKWTSMHLLYLCNTGLRGLRRSFRRLVSLRFLDLSQNHLERCPAEIAALKNLEVLALDDNKICQVLSPFLAVTALPQGLFPPLGRCSWPHFDVGAVILSDTRGERGTGSGNYFAEATPLHETEPSFNPERLGSGGCVLNQDHPLTGVPHRAEFFLARITSGLDAPLMVNCRTVPKETLSHVCRVARSQRSPRALLTVRKHGRQSKFVARAVSAQIVLYS